jgi:CheY-like chemotaxis protein
MTPDKKTVLVADDERPWRERARYLLSDEHNVETVDSGHLAVERIEQGGIDLLVLDHLMPGDEPFGTGFDVREHLRVHAPGLPVIIYTDAWQGVDTVRTELESKMQAPVVFKVGRDPDLDNLPARVKMLLSGPQKSPDSNLFCSECGQQVQETAKFCSSCGTKLTTPTTT